MLVDQYEREQALDVSRSFCVSAPAGSGKTELLTQRYLRLLLTVDEPEQVLAITFTRKARAEMSERILAALTLGAGPEPDEAYKLTTWQAAKAALAYDAERGWNLSHNPSRLRIQTIDSLNQAIAGESPLLNGFGASPTAVDDANSLYLQTVPRLLAELDSIDTPLSNALQQVLLVFNGDVDRFGDLLCKLLAKRDQWLHYTAAAGDSRLLEHLLQDSFTAWQQADMSAAYDLLLPYEAQLSDSLSFALQHGADKALAPIEQHCRLPKPDTANIEVWLALARFLLTAEGEVRARVDKKLGFPAPSASKNPDTEALYKLHKQRVMALLEQLRQDPDTVAALRTICLLPATLSAPQLNTAKHILLVLKYAVAHLNLVFAQVGQCDHVQIALVAANLLGDDDSPSATQMRWHNNLRHILIDEFQDTAFIQHTILQRLVALWPEARELQPQQQRSLFVVGDGMQSIYRFRAANVGLFLQAQQEGIGAEPLVALNLRQNFRSEKPLVDWFNQHFRASFPHQADAAVGAVPYCHAEPSQGSQGMVTLDGFANNRAEAEAIVTQIQALLASEPDSSIAILVRARSHLTPIIAALEQAHINYHSNDISHLKNIPEVIDIISITRWVLDANDSVALTSILRAPWCGAALNELYTLRRAAAGNLHIDHLYSLCDELPTRLQATINVLATSWQQRLRKPLAETVMGIWLALGGGACVSSERVYIDQYLDALRDNPDIDNIAQLERAIDAMFAKPLANDSRVNLMTIHKSKGLEFDAVFLPSLAKAPINDTAHLLEYAERIHAHQHRSFLLAPWGKSAADKQLRSYVKNLDKQASQHEQLRVLYVAATRARSRLALSFVYNMSDKAADKAIKPPAKNSLLSYIWPSVADNCVIHSGEPDAPATSISATIRPVRRLLHNTAIAATPPVASSAAIPTSKVATAETALGTLLHQTMEQIALNGGRISGHLRTYCVAAIENSPEIIDKAAANASLAKLIDHVSNTALGQWVVAAGTAGHSEWALTACNTDNSISRYVIDRSFVDATTRWIIDYKTSEPKQGQRLEDFLAQQAALYRVQLQQYAYAVGNLRAHKLAGHDIKIALYFPLINILHELN